MSNQTNLMLESQWLQYRNACYPPKNGPIPKDQEIETRQAFFAGCLVVLKFAVESTQNMSEEDSFAQICNLITEAQTVCSNRLYEMERKN